MSDLHSISKPEDAKMDIVFIHGLGGDHLSTWQHDMTQPEDAWPYWLAQKRRDLAVHSLAYQASPSHWLGEAMPLQDRAVEVLGELQVRGIGKRPLAFIGHSLGGLVIKQVLMEADGQNKDSPWHDIARQTRLVAFLATPHIGADMATWGRRLGLLTRASPALTGLQAHDAHLRTLDRWYRNGTERWSTIAFFETRPTNVASLIPWIKKIRFLGRLPTRKMIVDEGDADPKIPGVTSRPREDDHFSFCKPTRSDDSCCLQVEEAIDMALTDQDKTQAQQPAATQQDAQARGDDNVTPQVIGDGNTVNFTVTRASPGPTEAQAPPPAPPLSQAEAATRLHTLPAKNPDFVGREEDMAKIRAALDEGGVVITAIEGMGGIGKTAVGIEIANKLRDGGVYPGGVLFVDLEGFSITREPLSTQEALEVLLRPFVGPDVKLPDDNQALQRLWKQTTTDRQMLLFLDNARDEAQVRPLLPGHPSCKVLVTSRNRLDLDGIVPNRLDVMEEDKAAELAYTIGNRWQARRNQRSLPSSAAIFPCPSRSRLLPWAKHRS